MSVVVREATPDDIPGILEVMRAALGETPLLQRTPELFAWKHTHNPFGPSIVLVAESEGRLAGVRAFMRWELDDGSGGRIRCVRPVDTATHPDFERRGIFRQLTLAALDVARDDGVDLVFNTPNPRSGAGYLSMGWQEVGWVDVLARPRLGVAVGADADLAAGIPNAIPFESMDVPQRPATGLRTRRTPEYLRWRYASHPTVRYGLVTSSAGGAVVRVGARSGRSEVVLSDLLGDADHHTVRALVRGHRCRHVAAFFSKGRPERVIAVRGGVLPVPGLRTLRLVALPLSPGASDALRPEAWDIATGDLELL